MLPIVGLTFFAAISYESYRTERRSKGDAGRYFVWSTMQLDSDPLSRHHPSPCLQSSEPCVEWNSAVLDRYGRPGRAEKMFLLSALPAFFASSLLTFGLGNVGVNEIVTFMISMPLLTFGWFHFVGWLIDRRRSARSLNQWRRTISKGGR